MPKNDPTPPGTPTSAGQISDCDDYAFDLPKGLVLLQLGMSGGIREGADKNVFELNVDHVTSVGWLQSKAKEMLREKGGLPPGGFNIVWHDRILLETTTKVYDLADCWTDEILHGTIEPPMFFVVSKCVGVLPDPG